jgi:hypothetical protein
LVGFGADGVYVSGSEGENTIGKVINAEIT